jgi:predicted MFS family arabinose efflux permease
MIDLRFFTQPTFLGANVAAVAFAVSLLTMLTYIPIYLQSGLGLSPEHAGLLMLPIAVPLFVMPKIVTLCLAPRLSGRALLTIGLVCVAVAMVWLGEVAPNFDYAAMPAGMLLAGIGAGILNSETTKVGISAIPPERAGTASGINGTLRFSGIVIGFAALGAVLSLQIDTAFTQLLGAGSLPVSAADRALLLQHIVAGDLGWVSKTATGAIYDAAHQSFGQGYRAIMLTAAAFAAISALVTFLLVRARDTPPLPSSTLKAEEGS